MRIFRILFILIYFIPVLIGFIVNPGINGGYVLFSIVYGFLIIAVLFFRFRLVSVSFTFNKFLLPSLLTLCVILQFNDIVESLYSLFTGHFFVDGLIKASDRYSGKMSLSQLEWLGTILLFCSSLVLGLVRGLKFKNYVIVIYSLLMLNSLSGLARASFVINIIMLMSGLLVRSTSFMKSMSTLRLYGFVLGALFIAFLIYAVPQYGRVHDKPNAVKIVGEKAIIYSGGMYSALHGYVNSNPPLLPTGTSRTVGIISRLLGHGKLQGTYEPVKVLEGRTNIFTIYRGFIEDFGLLSLPLIQSILLFFVHLTSAVKTRIGFSLAYWSVPFFLFPFFSIFYFNNVLAGYLMFSAIINTSKKMHIK